MAHWGDRDGPALKAPASHQCNPGSSPIVDAICGLSLFWFPFFPSYPLSQKTNIPNFQFDLEIVSSKLRTVRLERHGFISS